MVKLISLIETLTLLSKSFEMMFPIKPILAQLTVKVSSTALIEVEPTETVTIAVSQLAGFNTSHIWYVKV